MTSRAAFEQSGDMQSSTLGKNTILVSPERLNQSRHERRLLKEHAGVLLPGARVSWCMHKVKPDAMHLDINYHAGGKKSFVDGVSMCGSIWHCPVCSQKLSQIRREEIAKALESKLLPVMLTFTISHNEHEKLLPMVEALKDSWRKLKSGKAWISIKSRFHIVHYVSTFEIRHGSNGWHPHFHVLLFLDMKEKEFEPGELKSALLERYKRLLSKHGKYILDEYGLHVKSCNGRKDLKEYLSKLSMQYEISQAASKIGKDEDSFSPFQLLAQSKAGNERAGKLFVEYAKCMSGRKFIQWSRGAREYFALDAEMTDEQAVEMLDAQEQAKSEIITLVRICKPAWYKVVRKRIVASLLRIADSGDAQAVSAFLELHEFRRDLDFEVIDVRD